MKVLVTQIERSAIYDGPGLRTVVFFKGCPLRCRWCANPETQLFENEVYFDKAQCIECAECTTFCDNQQTCPVSVQGQCINTEKCASCINNCPSGALQFAGHGLSVDRIMAEVLKDAEFYKTSGGGLTLSGGEVLGHAAISKEILSRAKAQGIHTCIETSGFGDRDELINLASNTDLFLFDIKLMNDATHKHWTGVDNKLILENLRALIINNCKVIIRYPLIPGVNDNIREITELVKLMHENGLKELHILPWHAMARDKYNRLNRNLFKAETNNDSISIEEIIKILSDSNILVNVGGIM